MLIARQKRKENIAEYILYMFQVEDLIRAFNFDISVIEKTIISAFDESYEVKREMREWYSALIGMMMDGGLQQSGHIPLIRSLISELSEIHLRLLDNSEETSYHLLYRKAKPALDELRKRSGNTNDNDVALSLNGLYGLLLLKIQKKKINPETLSAFGSISEFLAGLSQKFHSLEKGSAEL